MVDTPEDVKSGSLKGADVNSLFSGDATPEPSTAPTATSSGTDVPSGSLKGKDINSLIGMPETSTAPKQPERELTPEQAAYEKRIQSHKQTQAQRVKEEGAKGAFLHGLANVPFVTPAIEAGYRKYQANFGDEGQGATPEEREQDLRAQREAYNREVSAQHPYAEIGGELAQAIPMAFVPGVGWAGASARAGTLASLDAIRAARAAEAIKALGAGATAADIAAATKTANNLGVAAKLAPGAAEIAGFGAEGAGYGAASAAGENLFGTKQDYAQKSVPEAAAEGAVAGAGVAGVIKGAGSIVSKIAPDWLAGFLNKDKHAANTFMEKMQLDYANGDLNVDPKEFAARIAKGEPVSWFDVRGPETDRWLQQKFKNNQEGLENFKASLNERLADAPARSQAFLKKLAGEEGNFDIDAVREKARALAKKQNEENFGEAFQPENGQNSWTDAWNKALQNDDVGLAIDSVASTLSKNKGGKFENPFGTRGELGLETTGLDKDTIRTLKDYGIDNIYDLKNMTKDDAAKAFGLGENAISDTGRGPDVTNIYNALREPISGVNLGERVLLRPENANIEFMDNLQQKLNANADLLKKRAKTSSEEDYSNVLKNLSTDIRNALSDESHPSGLYNESYAKANAQREMAHLKDDALTAGENFLKKINDREYIDKAANDISKMSDEEKAFFKYGLLAQIEHAGITGGNVQTGAPQNVGLAYTKIKDWFAKDNIKRGLQNVLGEDGYHDLQNHLISEVFYKDAYLRAKDLGARGDGFSQFLRQAWIPGLGGALELALAGTPFFPAAIIIGKTANYYYGGNYARALADQLMSKDPKTLTAAYEKIFGDRKFFNDVNSQLAAMAYAASVQAGEVQYDSKNINKYTKNLDETQKKTFDEALLKGMNLYKQGKTAVGNAAQAAGYNKGGRVAYQFGGGTYDWRQHYTEKPDYEDEIGPRHILERGVGMPGWHGSPHDFDKFNDKNLLTGEGRSAFGPPSHYIAQRRDIAEKYRDKLTPKGKEGKLYQVKVAAHPNNFIDWHASWGEQHPEIVSSVKSALRDLGVKGMSPSEMKRGYITGEDLYNALTAKNIDPNDIKQALLGKGVKGIKYYDAYSRDRAMTFNPYYGKKGGGSRNFTVFDPNDIHIMNKYARGGTVDHWHPHHAIHREDGGRTPTMPIDPRQSEMERLGAERQQRMMASPLTNDVYHGSRNADIKEFRKSTKGYLPLILGTHTAKDPEISNTFTGNRDLLGGAMYPLKTYPDNRFYPVEQPILNGEPRHDDFSVVTDVLHELIKHTPGIGAHLIEKNRGVGPKEAKKIITQLLANQHYSEEQKKEMMYPHNDLKSFLADNAIDAPYGQEEDYAKSYARLMRSRGYKGLKYQNTSKREVQNAKDPTSYIVFHPESDDTDWHPLRSKFANFDPNKRTSRDIGDKRGGFIKRSTGGRIPEADKLFKDAKKYVDDRTKGLLNEPDERIVHALRIAKARNS